MKKILLPLLAVVLLLSFTIGEKELKTLKIGADAPQKELTLKGTDKKDHTLESAKMENGLLVVFSCNTCPFVVGNGETEGWEGRYNAVYDVAQESKVGMLLVNSNEAKRKKGDSMKDMIERAKSKGLKSTYVLDKDHVLADAFGAKTTPHVFLFDKDLKLVYTGAIDDNVDHAEKVEEHWLKNALHNLAKGEKITPDQTRNIGCSIKRVSK